ncbi:hypothetical protein GW17_00048772 [Ensete ventricosum]|nr:hypothetical protein GW17_00048772 [Ensete ventricosum]
MGLQMDPGAAGCHVGNQHEASWHQAYTSTEFLSALIPSSPYPLIQVRLLDGRPAHPPTPSINDAVLVAWQHQMGPADLPTMVPHEQVQAMAGCSSVPVDDGGAAANTYDGNAAPANVR